MRTGTITVDVETETFGDVKVDFYYSLDSADESVGYRPSVDIGDNYSYHNKSLYFVPQFQIKVNKEVDAWVRKNRETLDELARADIESRNPKY